MNTKLQHFSIRKFRMGFILLRIVMISCIAIYVLPIVFSFITSLKTTPEFYQNVWALPEKFRFENYIQAFTEGKIGEYFLNSVIIAATSLVLIQVFALSAAYALSRLKIPFANLILVLLLVIQVLPTESMIIPLYMMLSKTGMLKLQYAAIIIGYVGWSLPGTIIILKNYFETIPIELLEAARIDGSGEFNTMVKIILPLMKGAMSTCFVMNFTYVWGELMWAQIATLLTDKGIPITVGLLNFQGMFTTNWPMLTAAICMVMLPLFLIFLFLQKYFVAGLTNGGVKG